MSQPRVPIRDRPRVRRVAVGVIVATILIDFAAFSIPLPVLPSFLERLGAERFHVPLVAAMYPLGLVLFVALWGWISDRIGRRPVLLVSLLGTAFSFVLLALAPDLFWVYAARFLSGFFGASIGTAQAYMADLTDRESRTEGMGLVGAASGLGLFVGTAFGGLLGEVSVTLPFYVSAAVAALNFAIAAMTLPESRSEDPDPARWRDLPRVLVPAPVLVAASVHSGGTRLYLYLFLHIFFAFSALESIFPLFAAQRFAFGEVHIGLSMAAFGIILVLVQGALVGPLTRSLGEARLTIVGLTAMGLGTLGLSFSYSLPLLALNGIALSAGAGLAFPAFTSLFTKMCDVDETGEYLSHSQAMAHTGRAIGSLCWGWVIVTAGTGLPFFISGLATLGATALFMVFLRLLIPPR